MISSPLIADIILLIYFIGKSLVRNQRESRQEWQSGRIESFSEETLPVCAAGELPSLSSRARYSPC